MPVSLHACALAGGAQCACSRSLDDDVFAVLIRVLVRTPRRRGPGSRPVPLEPSERPEWAQNMALRWGELREADDFADTAHRRLLLLKRAIASVSLEMNTSAQHAAAATASDRLGCAIRCLRAVEEGRWLAAQRAVDEFPELIDQHRLQAAFAGNGEAQRALRDRAVQLDKEDIHQELRDLESASPGLPPEVAAARRETVADKIRRLKPGSGSHLTAIKGPDGNVSTDPEAIAQELARHWSGVFAERGVDDARLTAWLQESGARGDTSLPSHPGQWSVRRQDVHTALQQARATSPGPDGISAILWRRLGALAEDVLFDAACSLSSSSAPADLQAAYADELDDHAGAREHSFNLGLLCCVPKKAVELHPTFGEVYTAEGTRPLSLVDTSNRIMAGAYKQRWEGPLGQWVSSVQRGFLPWRSMLANVVELEHDAMLTATQKQRGMILLVDFKAAFPSVSHRFLRRCLEGFGMPGEALRVLDALYDQGRCKVAVGGARWPGFSLRSGIRQGCPLSPQVFATAMDLLLRVLTSRLGPAATIRAFADDVGIILTDIETQLPILELALREFGQLSGMEVDLPKTVGIPLWGGTMEEAAATVAQACPSWSQLPLRRAAVYLGCAVGPGKGDVMWSTALNKFRERVGGWQWSDMGLHFAAAAYNSYALPVLSFLVQVAAPTDDVLAAESWALRRAAPGPGNWAMPEDHWGLKENYGMPRSFGSLQDLTKAAQLRVFHCENSAHGGLQLEVRAAQLRTAAALSRFPERFLLWATWFSTAIPAALCRNADELRAQSITTAKVEAAAAEGGRTFQAAARELIAAKARRDPHFRIRHKFERWQLPGAPRTAATRFEHNLQRLRGLVPPRVVAAVFSTGWNRWCTARRFQRRAATSNFCKLGCGGVAEDSIEHYTRCRAVRRFHATSMRIDADWLLPHWLVVHHTQRSDVDLVLGALRAYAVYRATNAARALGGMTAEGAARALQQALRDAVAGHRGAERVLRGCADLLVGACRSIRGCGGPRLSEALVSRQGSFAGLPGASPLGASSSTPAAPPCAGGDAASPAASPLQGAAAHLAAEGHAAAARSTPHARRSPSRPRPSKSPPPSGGGPAGFASAPAAATTEGAPCRRPRPPQELPSLGAARLPGEAPEARRATSSSSRTRAPRQRARTGAPPPVFRRTRFSNRSGRSTWSSSAASVATLGSASPSPAGGRDASRGAARAAAAASQQAPRRDRSLHEPPPSLGDAPPGGSPAPPSATRSASRTAGAEVQRRTAADHLPQKASLQAQRLSLRELGEEFRRCLEERGTAPRDGLPGGPPRRPATEEASSATAARPASREERMREVAESLGVPLKAVRSAHALFQEYAGDAAAAVAGDLRGGRAVGAAPGGGELGRAQFELLVEELSDMQPDPRRIAELREAFNQADAEDSGSISFDQFAVLLCKHSFSEFMIVDRICEREQNRKLARESGMTLVEVEDLRLDYRKYDENGDGTIDKEEFKLLLQDRLKVKLQDIPTTRVQHWWRCADENMDGTISFEEFIRFHRRFFGATRSKANPLDGFYRSGGLTGRLR
ncbi:unnamed protein product [Prorocentrum cordatum]|uniref:Calmodulin n=1 Tax=Prorocentrum cordatum TaxID=2364126 RepID=A0ABN9XFI0_9DINO|nr:unnamed protein product [Polarella glacialis]